jgi:hypothetical protein
MLSLAGVLALLAAQEVAPGRPQEDYRPPGYLYADLPNPWGRSGWNVLEFPFQPRGIFVQAGVFGADDLDVDVPRAIEIRSDGVGPPLQVAFEYERMSLEGAGAGLTVDLDGIRFSLLTLFGDFEARGTLRVNDSMGPETQSRQTLEGDYHGFRLIAYWPAFLRYRTVGFEGSLGPSVGVAWAHTKVERIPGSPLPYGDVTDQLHVSAGLRLSFRATWGRLALGIEGEYAAIGGDAVGAGFEASVGFGVNF